MSVPSRVAAAALLTSLGPPAWHLRHSRAVAEVAGWLAREAEARGARVDRRLVEAAALLHDVDKAIPRTNAAARLPHGEGSALWLARQGHGELGPAVAAHPVTRLVDGASDRWLADASIEELVVAYADKRAGQRLESMASRFADWAQRYPDGWSVRDRADAWRRAIQLEAMVCGRAGVEPEAVRRLPWTAAALRSAHVAVHQTPADERRPTARRGQARAAEVVVAGRERSA